jgi:hypothetical protein
MIWLPPTSLRRFAAAIMLWSSAGLGTRGSAGEPLLFRAHPINAESEFCSAAAIDVNGDSQLDILSGGWWYEAPHWQRHHLRDVERIGNRFDDYSNLP